MSKVNSKGLLWFLFLTFFSTYLVEFVMILKGFSLVGKSELVAQLTVAMVMFFPGISAFIVRKFITKEGFGDDGLHLGKKRYYLQTYLLIPIIFALIYGLTWLFIQGPDFSLGGFLKQYSLPNLPLPPFELILAIFVSTITFAPFLNSTAAFGEEYGWRGYLLAKLLPLGTKRALMLSGLIWGLWHMPLIIMGYTYGNQTILGIIFFSILLIFIGVYIGYLRIISGSVILAAFAHGTFNAQAYGIWKVIFPNLNPLLGGYSGLTGIFVFLVITVWILRKIKN